MLKKIWNFTKDLVNAYIEDDGFTKGAALAYYTTFSLAPIIIVIIAVAGIFYGKEAMEGQVFSQLEGMIGPETAATVQDLVKASYNAGGNWWVTTISVGTLIFGATGAFNQLKLSLDKIWELESKPKNGLIGFIMARLVSFSLVLSIGFILLVSLVVNAVAVALSDKLTEYFSVAGEVSLALFGTVISLALTGGVFALIFKYLPDAKVRWREVLWGSLFTAVLFALGQKGISYYIGNSSITSGFGAAGSLVALLVWTYYSSQIVFLGAEFIWTLGKMNGHPVLPDSNAVKVVKVSEKMDEAQAHRYERRAAANLAANKGRVSKSTLPKPAGGRTLTQNRVSRTFVHESESRIVANGEISDGGRGERIGEGEDETAPLPKPGVEA